MPSFPTAEVILRSRSTTTGVCLTTFALRYWKAIHGELMTHRVFSRNASSSRAVPVSRLMQEVTDHGTRAEPVIWNNEQKGMSGGDELDPKDAFQARIVWATAAGSAWAAANALKALNIHKSIVNRVLEPYSSINVLVTTTELNNFFGLRLDKGADPTIRYLAQQMYDAVQNAPCQELAPGEWHLPYISDFDRSAIGQRIAEEHGQGADFPRLATDLAIKVSVARCARVSYKSFDTVGPNGEIVKGKTSTIDEDLKLYARLIESMPIHASPAEHQATPDDAPISIEWVGSDGLRRNRLMWNNEHQHGNFSGWRQYRKMIAGESRAPLPFGYLPI